MRTVQLSEKMKTAIKAVFYLIVLVLATLVAGCADKQYVAVQECVVVEPPTPGRYVSAMPDEQLVMMTDVYIAQVRAVTDCNINIKAMNARNKASEPK